MMINESELIFQIHLTRRKNLFVLFLFSLFQKYIIVFSKFCGQYHALNTYFHDIIVLNIVVLLKEVVNVINELNPEKLQFLLLL